MSTDTAPWTPRDWLAKELDQLLLEATGGNVRFPLPRIHGFLSALDTYLDARDRRRAADATPSIDETSLHALNDYAKSFGTDWFVTRLDRRMGHDGDVADVELRSKGGVVVKIERVTSIVAAIAHVCRSSIDQPTT